MKNFRIYILIFFFCSVSVLSFAQNGSEDQQSSTAKLAPGQKFSAQEYREAKIEYVIDCAKLTSKEKNAFTPVYTELYNKKRLINYNAKKLCREYSKDGITEQEYMSMIDSLSQAKIDIANLQKEYIEKFKKILPAEKLYKAMQADEKFDGEILKQMQKQKQDQNQEQK